MCKIDIVRLGHINLRGNVVDRMFTDKVATVLGQELPRIANTMSVATHRVYWLGPDEWQIVTEPGNTMRVMRELHDTLRGQHAAANDLSGGQVAFHLSGPKATRLLAKSCSLDLHPSIFPVAACAQSGLAKASMLLGCIDSAPVYEIIVRRSFSEYVSRWLRQK